MLSPKQHLGKQSLNKTKTSVLWATGNTFEIVHSKLQKALFQFEKFSQNSDLPIASTKSKIMRFHQKRNNFNVRLTLNGIIFPE